MLIDDRSLAIALACRERKHGYDTDHVNLKPDGTMEATDGRMLLIVESCSLKDGDFPAVGQPDTPPSVPKKGAMLSASLCADVRKNIPKANKRFSRLALGSAVLVSCSKKDGVELATTDLKRTKKEGAPWFDGSFPSVQSMISGHYAHIVAREWFSVSLLKKMLQVVAPMVQHDDGLSPSIELGLARWVTDTPKGREQRTGLMIRGDMGGGRRLVGFMAPMNTDGAEKFVKPSDWEKKACDAKDVVPSDKQVRFGLGAIEKSLACEDDDAPTLTDDERRYIAFIAERLSVGSED